jgi:hypothetical protein
MADPLEEFVSLLGAAQSEWAAQRLTELQQADPTTFVNLAAQTLLTDGLSEAIVWRAILLLSSVLTVRPSLLTEERVANLYRSIPGEQRAQLCQALVRGLMFETEAIREGSARLLAILSKIEGSVQAIHVLLQLLQGNQDEYPQVAYLGALTALREMMAFRVVSRSAHYRSFFVIENGIFEAVMLFLANPVPPEFKTAAVRLLSAALGIFPRFVDKAELRTALMQAIFGNWDVEDRDLRVALYRFLIRFSRAGYQFLDESIGSLFELQVRDLSTGDPTLVSFVLRFWKDLAKNERNVPLQRISSGSANLKFLGLISSVAETLTPIFLRFLPEIGDPSDDDTDTYGTSLSHQARKTLSRFLKIAPEPVLPPICGYYEENIDQGDWHYVFGALSAASLVAGQRNRPVDVTAWFSRVLEGRVQQLCQHEHFAIRMMAFDCIANIVRSKFTVFENNEAALDFVRGIAGNFLPVRGSEAFVCHVITRYCQNFPERQATNALESLFAPLAQVLLGFATSRDSPVLTAAGGTLRELLRRAPMSLHGQLTAFLTAIIDQIAGLPIDAGPAEFFLVAIAGATALAIRTPDPALIAHAFEVVWTREFTRESHSAEALSALGEFLMACGDVATQYRDRLLPALAEGQTSQDLTFQIGTTVLIGDLFRGIWFELEPWVGDFVRILLANLESVTTPIHLCSEILNSLGDICGHASQELLLPYRDEIVAVVERFTLLKFEPGDKESIRSAEAVFGAVLYLASQITFANREDVPFIEENKKKIFRLFLDRILSVSLFHSKDLHRMVLKFLTDLTGRDMPCRKYNVYLNNQEIKKHLEYLKSRYQRNRGNEQDVWMSVEAMKLAHELPKK